MTSTATSDTAAAHLTYVIDSWPHLIDMLDTRHATTWPPVMGIEHVLDGSAEETHAELLAARAITRLAERADSRYTLGASPAPIRLQVVDVMRTIDADLVHLCDVLSQEITRPPMKHAPAHWTHADRVKRDLMADRDAADPRRWHRRHARSAPVAAAWLLGRVQAAPGPFLPLGPSRLRQISTAAGRARKDIEQTLDGVRTAQVVGQPCPLCGGTLGMSSGDGGAPLVACFRCQQEWSLVDVV